MTPIEILALIFALLILAKIVFVFTKPKFWMELSQKLMKENMMTTLILLLLAGVTGYYVFTGLSIVQVSAVMLFNTLLIGIGMLPYSKEFMKFRKEIVRKDYIVKKFWISMLIWTGIAVWTLYTILV